MSGLAVLLSAQAAGSRDSVCVCVGPGDGMGSIKPACYIPVAGLAVSSHMVWQMEGANKDRPSLSYSFVSRQEVKKKEHSVYTAHDEEIYSPPIWIA